MKDKNLVKPVTGLRGCIHRETTNTYADALRRAVELLHARRKMRGTDFKHKYILFVPDKYTLLAEKLLYADGGSFDAEVLTLNRLYYRLIEYSGQEAEEKPLSRLGAVLTVRRILNENVDLLGCFKKSAGFAGFGETVYDNICQFAASGLMPEDLPDDVDGIAGRKLRDLKIIYTLYNRAVEGKYVDASGRLLLLRKLLGGKADYLAHAETYFACFDEFTKLQSDIVQKICAQSEYAYIAQADCRLEIKGDVEEYAALSRTDELKAAAVRIRNLALGGVSYDDMGVLLPKADFNRLSRIFDEFGIPFFTDKTYPLSSHPLARYISDLFAAAQSPTNENYIRLAKNPYAGVTNDEADIFENYVYYCASGEGAMRNSFTIEPEDAAFAGARDIAERVRVHLRDRINAVGRKEIRTGADMCAAVRSAIPPDEAEITASIDTPIPEACAEILAAVAVLGEVFTGYMPFEKLQAALAECFAAAGVAVLPNRANTVEVGDVSVFRASGYKYLFVLGMQEGELPAVMRDDGLLRDRDLEGLAQWGAVIEPKIEMRNARAEAELIAVLSASEHLFLSYCVEAAPSPLLARVKNRALPGRLKISSTEGDREKLHDGAGAADWLVYLCPTRAAARELFLTGTAERAAGGSGFGYESELRAATGEIGCANARSPVIEKAGRLYHGRLSVSRIQEFFACPLRCFLRYGLKLKPRPDGAVSPLDLGTFLHRVIELFVRGGMQNGVFDASRENLAQIVTGIVHDEPRLLRGASDDFVQELIRESAEIAAVVASQIEKGSFKPALVEERFGAQGALKGHEIKIGNRTVTLEGIIDRLDVCARDNAARVIDYKTGHTEFTLADIYYGRKVQLAVYLKVARENGYVPAGMFYFPFSSGFAAERNGYRLLGMFDAQYAYEMDNNLAQPQYASDVVYARSATASSREKTVLHKNGSGAVTGETLEAVCDYADAVLCGGAREMLNGYCEAAPLQSGNRSECAYCEMQTVCSAYGGVRRVRRRRNVKAAFLETCTATFKNGRECL